MKNERAVITKFYIIQVTQLCVFGSMQNYVGAFMLTKGLSNTGLSIMTAMYMLLAFFGQFFWGALSDRFQANKKVFMIGEMAVLSLYFLIYYLSGFLALIYILYPLLGFVLVPMSSTLDSWIIKLFTHRPGVYGPSRGIGSLGFAVFSLFYGRFLASIGYHVMPWFGTFFLLISFVLAATQPSAERTVIRTEESTKKEKMKASDILTLVRIPAFSFTLVMLFLVGIAKAPMVNLTVVLLENVGGDVSYIGYESFIGCLAQFPFLLFAGKLRKIPQNFRVLMAIACLFLTVVGVSLSKTPQLIVFFSVFWYIGYAILLPTYREITEENVPDNIRSTAHGICDAVFQSFAAMIAMFYTGSVIDNFGFRVMFIICIVLTVMAAMSALMLMRVNKKSKV